MTRSVLHARASGSEPLEFSATALPAVWVTTAHTESGALDSVGSAAFDCLVIEDALDSGSGLSLLAAVRAQRPSVPVVFATASPDGRAASEATRYDVSAYHVRDGEESLESRVVDVLAGEGPPDSEAGRPVLSDGAAATHGTPFLQIAETINDAVVTIDADSYIQFANDALADLVGEDRERLVGERFTTLMPERFREAHEAGIERYLETGQRRVDWDYVELAVAHADGHEIPVAVSFSEFDRDGERFFTGVIRDISERKSRADSLEQLHDVASDRSLSSLEKVSRVLEDHRQRLGVSMAFFSRIEDGTEELIVATGDHELAEEGLSVPLEDTYCQYTIASDEAVIIPDAEDSDLIPGELYESFGFSCYLGETVLVDGEPYGTVCFVDERTAGEEFSDADVAFLEVLADWIGYELTQKRQRDQLERERERAERILERIDDAFFAVDDDWEFTYFNPRAEEVLGRPREEVLGENVWECFPEAVGSAFDEQYHRAMESQEPVVFEEYYAPLSTWFEVSAYPDEEGLSVYFTDITDRKEHADALAALHDQTQELVRATSRESIAETVLEATMETLGHEFCSVQLLEGEKLRPVAVSAPADSLTGGVPVYEADCWGLGEALQRQAPVLVDAPVEAARAATAGPSVAMVEPFPEVLFVPIGEYGVLSVGAESGGFDDADRSLAELLASHAAMAIERVERESELLTNQTVLETLQGMVYAIDTDRQFELVTDPLARWLGYDRAELLSMPPEALLVPEQRDRLWRHVERLSAGDADHLAFETEIETAEGERLPVEIELSRPPPDAEFQGTIGVVRDRTRLEATRERLESERDRFQYLFNNLPDAVSEARFEDGTPVVTAVNDAFEDVFGYAESELIGEPINDRILPPEAEPEGRAIDRTAASGEFWSGEVRRLTADGRRYFLFRGVPYTDREGRQRGFGIYTDITERKQRERRLEVLTRVLRHNIRNEFTVLLGYAEMLREYVEDEQLSAATEAVLAGLRSVSELSEDARRIQETLESDDRGLERNLADAVGGIVEEYGNGNVECNVSNGLTARIDGRVELALSHLIENAVEHAGEAPEVRVSATAADGDVVLSVEDDGPGIPDLEWEVITGQTEITQLSHGSGLGLWAAKWVAESYGGRIERFESELGGTGIRLRLPGILSR